MPDSTHSSTARVRWAALCLTLVLGGCDPLGLASLFDRSPAMGTSVLTLLDTQDRTLELGDDFVGALSAADFVGLNGQYLEAWALEGKEGESFSIDLISHDFDSHLYVVGPGLSETLSDDDSGGACHARIQLTVLESGTFHVVASTSSSNQMGTYQLTVSEEARPRAAISCGGLVGSTLTSMNPRGELSRGETSFGSLTGAEPSIENSRPVQAWRLEGRAGETVVISLRSDDYDSYLYFFGPGMVEALTNDDGGSGLNSELTVTFAETGVYTVGAAALSSGSTGSYNLTVTDPIDLAELSTEGRRLSVGMDSYAMLSDLDPVVEGKPVQAWAFEARAGQQVTIDLMSEDFDSYLRVVGPGLSPLTDDDGGNDLDSRLVVTFPQDGEYRIIASSLGGSTGSFTLQVR